LQDTAASNLNLEDDDDLRQAGAPEPNVGSVPNTHDQIAALAAAVAQIQQAFARQLLNHDIAAQAAPAPSLPSDATTDPGHQQATLAGITSNDLNVFQRGPDYSSYNIDNDRGWLEDVRVPNCAGSTRGEARPSASRAGKGMVSIRAATFAGVRDATRRHKGEACGFKREFKFRQFAVGDEVLLVTKNLRVKKNAACGKLTSRYIGPFKVKAIAHRSATLDLPRALRITPRVSGLEKYEIEKLLARRVMEGQVQYLVRWTGYDPEEDSWEPAEGDGAVPEWLQREFGRFTARKRGLDFF
jgi:hypothetical protein